MGGTPWEFPRPEATYTVRLGGTVRRSMANPSGRDGSTVLARAHDMVVPGHGTQRVSTLRLWKALAPQPLDLHAFNDGDIAAAAAYKNQCESISWVLYPNDSTDAGQELRLKQEYFLVSAAMQDLVARHLSENPSLLNLADKVSIHLNDTHPAMSVAELMRLLVDEHGLAWDTAWACARRPSSYTNHTLMPEALETWPVTLMQRLLPRHLEIIYRINHEFLLGRHPAAGRQRLPGAPVADRRGGRAPRAHGQPVHRGQPHGQWRVGPAFQFAGARPCLPTLRPCGPSALST